MPIDLNSPVVDDRLPMYACGPSFGMLGPSRVVVFPGATPAGYEFAANGLVLGYKVEGSVSPPYFVQYKGKFGGLEVSLFVACLVLNTGSWRVGVDVNTSPPGGAGTSERFMFNFTWGFPPLSVPNATGPWAGWTVYRTAEWHTLSEKWNSLTLPDEV